MITEQTVYASASVPCAVRALRAWLDAAGMTEGPIFCRVDRYRPCGSYFASLVTFYSPE